MKQFLCLLLAALLRGKSTSPQRCEFSYNPRSN